MDRGIAELVRNLGEIQPLTADELFGRIDLHAGKIVDDPTAAPFAEQLLHLGAADQVVTADLLDGKLTGQVVFQIGKEPFVNIPVRSAVLKIMHGIDSVNPDGGRKRDKAVVRCYAAHRNVSVSYGFHPKFPLPVFGNGICNSYLNKFSDRMHLISKR